MTNLTEQDLLDKFVEIVENSRKTVFFGGAGVSTESGIPDFRSTDGLYNTKYDYQPETILSDEFFYAHAEEFDAVLVVTPHKTHPALVMQAFAHGKRRLVRQAQCKRAGTGAGNEPRRRKKAALFLP